MTISLNPMSNMPSKTERGMSNVLFQTFISGEPIFVEHLEKLWYSHCLDSDMGYNTHYDTPMLPSAQTLCTSNMNLAVSTDNCRAQTLQERIHRYMYASAFIE